MSRTPWSVCLHAIAPTAAASAALAIVIGCVVSSNGGSALAVGGSAAAVLLASVLAGGLIVRRTTRDSSHGRRIESLLEHEKQLIEMVATGRPLPEVLEALCAFVEAHNPGVAAAVALLDTDGVHLRSAAAPHLPEAYSLAIDGLEIGPEVGSCGTAAYRKTPVIVQDIANDALWRKFRDLGLSHGLRACWSTPILSTRGDVLGTLSAYYHETHAPQPQEDYVVQRAKHIAALAIEQHRAGHALRESEARYATIVQSEPECVKVIGPIGELLEMNRAGLAMLDAENLEQIRARGLLAFVAPEHHRRFLALHRRVLEGETGTLQFDMISVKGVRRHMETHGAPLRDTAGRIYAFLGITRDVTDRKLADEAVRESELRFRQLAENIKDVFWLTDPHHTEMLYVSPAYEQIWGRPCTELYENPKTWLQSIHESDRERVAAALHLEQASGGYDLEYRVLRPDGSIRWIHDRAAPIRDDSGKVVRVAGIAEDITERRQAQERLTQLAQYDALTGLPNRNLLRDRLGFAIVRAKRDANLTGLLVLDLDHFKEINDTLGHDAGDEVLREVARRMRAALRDTDTLARLGGDEFVIIVESALHIEQIEEVAHKIQSALHPPILLQGRELFVTSSIGVAAYPAAAEEIESLLKNADIAMYRAKHAGRNAIVVYSHESHSKSGVRLTVESNLRRALERDEFTLHYQPQVDIATGRIMGAEALIRWNNPELGLVSPLRFISIAEETGLIVPIGEWVLQTAAAQTSRWHACGLTSIAVAVNLSPRQFRQANLASVVGRILRDSGLAAGYCELEITEGAVMQNAAAAVGILHQLAEMGVQISIDDFGTGYSSLAYLQRFPVHKIKIDQSFVRTIQSSQSDAPIAAAIVAMAQGLKMTAIAEGVETRTQLDVLTRLGCQEYQGYYFSKPLPAPQFEQLLARHAGRSVVSLKPAGG